MFFNPRHMASQAKRRKLGVCHHSCFMSLHSEFITKIMVSIPQWLICTLIYCLWEIFVVYGWGSLDSPSIMFGSWLVIQSYKWNELGGLISLRVKADKSLRNMIFFQRTDAFYALNISDSTGLVSVLKLAFYLLVNLSLKTHILINIPVLSSHITHK